MSQPTGRKKFHMEIFLSKILETEYKPLVCSVAHTVYTVTD